MSKRHVSRADRKHIFFRDKYACRYCGVKEGERFDGKPLTPAQAKAFVFPGSPGSISRGMGLAITNHICVLTVDHIIPVSRGGSDLYANLVAACRPCNTRKADMTVEEAGMTLLGEPMPGHRIGQQRTIILVKGAEFFGE